MEDRQTSFGIPIVQLGHGEFLETGIAGPFDRFENIVTFECTPTIILAIIGAHFVVGRRSMEGTCIINFGPGTDIHLNDV
jgi:hypothetical protein